MSVCPWIVSVVMFLYLELTKAFYLESFVFWANMSKNEVMIFSISGKSSQSSWTMYSKIALLPGSTQRRMLID